MMRSDTDIDYAVLGEYTAFSDKARDAARRRHAEMCMFIQLPGETGPKPGISNES
ncbi:hypothetical protein ACIUPB_002972 [Escherichia coli]